MQSQYRHCSLRVILLHCLLQIHPPALHYHTCLTQSHLPSTTMPVIPVFTLSYLPAACCCCHTLLYNLLATFFCATSSLVITTFAFWWVILLTYTR